MVLYVEALVTLWPTYNPEKTILYAVHDLYLQVHFTSGSLLLLQFGEAACHGNNYSTEQTGAVVVV